MAFTTVPSGDMDPESPLTTSLINALYDNPIEIAQAGAGAPQVVQNAIDWENFSPASDGSQSIPTTSYWTPTAGFYQIIGPGSADVNVQLYASGAWQGGPNEPSGLILSDGSNIRFYNPTGISKTMHYQKF